MMRWLTLLLLAGCAESTVVDSPRSLVSISSLAQPLVIQVPPVTASIVKWADVAWTESDPSVASFNLYYGFLSPHVYDNIIIGITNLDGVISNLVPGTTYYFVATAVDTNGTESDFSSQYVFVMPTTVEIGFSFNQSATNVVVQSSPDLMNWRPSNARLRTNGLWRIDVDGNLPVEFYRGVGQAFPPL